MSMANHIRLPANPFWSVFRRFGRDELTGAVIALLATAALELYFHLSGLTASILLLALAGPVVEKVGFFFWHFESALDTYRTTVPADRQSLGFYIKSAIKGGSKTLIEDILVHDPLYIALMFGGMSIHPQTPAWLLVPVAFTVAVVVVAFAEVGFTELQYRWFRNNLYKNDFKKESYFESRFELDSSVNPEDVLQQLRQEFIPNAEPFELNYSDTYYDNDLPCFNGRSPKVRIRIRDKCRKKNGTFVTTQVVYTRAEEQEADKPVQFRLFPSNKDKFYRVLGVFADPLNMTEERQIEDWAKLGVNVTGLAQCIGFTRRIIRDPRRLFISIDTIRDSGTTVVEIKAYPDNTRLMKEAMRFVMHRFPVLQTTYGKTDL